MRLKKGDTAPTIELPAIDGSTFSLESMDKKPYMLAFYRFAACPFCNLRVHELVSGFNEFGEDFNIVTVFDSPIDNLTRHTEGHLAPFPIVADEKNVYYKKYGVEHSFWGFLFGMILRFPTLMKAMFMGYLPLSFKGRLTTMPAEFMIDRNGVIQTAFYAQDEGEHLPFDLVKEFSLR